MEALVNEFMNKMESRNPHEPEFLQAVQEVAETIIPYAEDHPKYKKAKILERIAEPERVIMFRVPWLNDQGEVEVNRGLVFPNDSRSPINNTSVRIKRRFCRNQPPALIWLRLKNLFANLCAILLKETVNLNKLKNQLGIFWS